MAAFNVIRSFAPSSVGISIRIFIDNSTAVSYINRSGGTHSRSCSRVAQDIVLWCESRSIRIEAVFIPGKLNTVADAESRSLSDSSDWSLCPAVFSKILELWSVDIDLFASSWNAQLPVFCSWQPQPGAFSVDAFSLSWSGWKSYVFPHFSLILRCLGKVRREKTDCVLISPFWPGQPWFPLLLAMSVDIPRVLTTPDRLLQSPLGDPHLLLSGGLILVAWKLSGDPSGSKVFRNRLSSSSWPEFVHPRRLRTSPRGMLGIIGVLGGKQIPCLHI